MRKTIMTAAILVALLTVASATTKRWYNTMFGHYAATLRLIQYGKATVGINEIFFSQIASFIKTEDVRIAVIAPNDETQGAYGLDWTFFGSRFLPLESTDGTPSFYGMSYMGSNDSFHGSGFDALIEPSNINSSVNMAPQTVFEKGLLKNHMETFGKADFTKNAHFSPLSWNSKDVDGDGKGDLALGGLVYLSTSNFHSYVTESHKGAEYAFIDTAEGVLMSRLLNGRLSVVRYETGWGLRELAPPLQISDVVVNAGHSLLTAPARAIDRIVVRQTCGLQTYRYISGKISADACITGLVGGWAMTGAVGDFDGDSYPDFWIAQTDHGSSSSPNTSNVKLISGSLLASATGNVSIAALTIATIEGSDVYSNYDGIGTTLSAVAGDFDNDGKPDFSFTGHRHMNEAGAMYIIKGSDIVPGMNINISDNRIIKIVGPMMAQLAPPYHHWDATDFNGDGYDDIVVSADNDVYSGINAGAVYVLSGKAIAAY